ncbi:hypothetical protein FACS189411_03090 [Bacteroidia bacterium]|nr:hypothetical protein FACS189411_03090 [Bacteroidia bacterium]
MKRIIHRELLNIFSHTESAEDEAKDIALGEFADELQSYCRQEKDLAERTRTLRFARSELAVAQERIHTGAGKNVLLQDIATQVIGLIDCELEIVKMEREHPERFVKADNAPASLAKWNGAIAELLELSVSIG